MPFFETMSSKVKNITSGVLKLLLLLQLLLRLELGARAIVGAARYERLACTYHRRIHELGSLLLFGIFDFRYSTLLLILTNS